MKFAYLSDRAPLALGTNFGGIWLSPTNRGLLRLVHGPDPEACRSLRAKTLATFINRVLR